MNKNMKKMILKERSLKNKYLKKSTAFILVLAVLLWQGVKLTAAMDAGGIMISVSGTMRAEAASAYDFGKSRGSAADGPGSGAADKTKDKAESSVTAEESVSSRIPADTVTKSIQSQDELLNSYALKVYELTNTKRKENGMPQLKWNESIRGAAFKRAEEASESFSHTRPGGERFYSIFEELGIYEYKAVGENLAMGQDTPEEVVNAWMSSPTHRANILSDKFTDIGVSCRATDHGIVWVQEFYRPMR